MSSVADYPALKECLESLNHLFIDITRLKHEPAYEEKRGGYCDLQVATLDQEIPSAGKLVAAKKLLLGIQSNEPLRLALRLARELKVWAGLRHPHVLPLLGFYVDDNYKTAVLISEYMEHGDLKDYIVRVKPSHDARLWLIRDLTDGLAYLHTRRPKSVRHGDLKPRNVLVNSHTRALITDFGLSKVQDAGPTGFTTGNDARCTVRFSSPEILLQGNEAESIANDIWSWGCLVLEALTDEVPFAEIQAEPQLILALAKGRSPCDRENLALRLPQLQDLLAKCWSFQASQRPTAAECLGVVQDALSLGWWVANRSLSSGRTAQQEPLGRRPSDWDRTPTPPPVTQSPQALKASSQVDQQPQSYPSTQLAAQGTGGSSPQSSLWISSSPLASEDSWPQHGRSADSPVPSFEGSVQEWASREDIPEDEEYIGSQTSATTMLVETSGGVAGSSGTRQTSDAPDAHSTAGESRKARSSGRFPHKLYQLVGDSRVQLFINWSSDGKNIVFLDHVALLSSGVISNYFSHNNWTSLVRQLGLYGFRKVKSARADGKSHAYHHHNFLRGREDLLDMVKPIPRPAAIRRALAKQALQSTPDPLPPMT